MPASSLLALLPPLGPAIILQYLFAQPQRFGRAQDADDRPDGRRQRRARRRPGAAHGAARAELAAGQGISGGGQRAVCGGGSGRDGDVPAVNDKQKTDAVAFAVSCVARGTCPGSFGADTAGVRAGSRVLIK